MKKRNKAAPTIFFTSIITPTVLSSVATRYMSVALLAVTIIAMFFMLKIPVFKHRENLWMFVMATFATIPANIYLIKIFLLSFLFDDSSILSQIIGGFVIYSALFATEQLVLGILTRLIYRRQHKLFPNTDY